MEISKLANVHLNNYSVAKKINFSGISSVPNDSFEISSDTKNRKTKVDKIIAEMENTVNARIDGDIPFRYPQIFKNRIMNGEFKFGDWEISTGKFFVATQMKALEEKFGIRNLVPFATQENSNILACFVSDKDNSGKVVEFDAYGSPDNINLVKYDNFEEWVFKKL